MENRPSPLWNQNRDASKNLRQPNTSIGNRLKLEDSAPSRSNHHSVDVPPKSTESDLHINVLKSNLSVDAPEFVPAYLNNSMERNIVSAQSVQHRLKKHKTPENVESCLSDFIDTPDDNRLQHLIATLTKDPGQFFDLHNIFMETLDPYFDDVVVLSRAAQLLVDQAIISANFRYTAARLCCAIEQCCPNFRAELHLTCKKQLTQHENKAGLLLFVAELYTQLHHENIYGNYLIEAFKHLLEIGGNENVKCICQALKLTGYNLEKYDKKALDDVFVKLKSIIGSVTGTAESLIKSVINLRGSNWGHTVSGHSDTSSNCEPDEEPYWGDSSNTVFYNQDGSKFSNEEAHFLAMNMNYTEDFEGELSDPDELCDPEPEMDEEIQAAFKEFVKSSKR